MKTIFVMTETKSVSPGYVFMHEDVDGIVVSVRSHPNDSGSFVKMTRDELIAMHIDIGAYLSASVPAVEAVVSAPTIDVVATDTED